MTDYIKELEEIENKLVEFLREKQDSKMNITELLEKAEKAGINKGKTILRDAIISASAKKKLKIEMMKPKQLLISLQEKK
jgi:cell division septum initiation protein DivIVA